MEKTLPEGSLSGSGISDMMFDQVMGSALSEGGGIGLAEILYRDLQIKHTQNSAESDSGISLQDLLLDPVRKENNDD
ncbi:rod-binding protein [Candidatus Neomarinimicrobiota bacterium]